MHPVGDELGIVGHWRGLRLHFPIPYSRTAAVPEPATMSLLALGGLALLKRKK